MKLTHLRRVCAYRLRWDCRTKLESLLGQDLGRLGDGDVNECVELRNVLVVQLGRDLATVFAEGRHSEVSVVGRWREGMLRTCWAESEEQRRREGAANE